MGEPPDGDETVAEKVTHCPTSDGFREEAKVVVVVAFPTTCQNTFDVLPPKFESPPYIAVIGLLPIGSAEVVTLAEPLLNAPVPNIVVFSMNVTVSPSGGAPKPGVTAAVKVTACPGLDGFGEDESIVAVGVIVMGITGAGDARDLRVMTLFSSAGVIFFLF